MLFIMSIRKTLILFCLILSMPFLYASDKDTTSTSIVYIIDLKQDIDKSSSRRVSMGIMQAKSEQADFIIIDMSTYGGAVDAADSIRVAILDSSIPIISFINIQAASAGALISIACDSIYMRSGASIGAATVVDQEGKVMPDKYQSFMRGMMRSTAESHGKKTIMEDGVEKQVWHRDPQIAEQMVDTANVLSYTVEEAIANGFCEGKAESIEEVIEYLQIGEYEVVKQKLSAADRLILILLSPVLQSIFLMLIIGGIYFELQSPGIGFPLAAAIIGALLYFAPLYVAGLAMHWEIVLFVIGVILLIVEIFVTPGFGVAGIAGITTIITSLVFAMIDNDLFYFEGNIDTSVLLKPVSIVLLSTFLALVFSIWGASRLYSKNSFSRIVLQTELKDSEGWVGVEVDAISKFIGMKVIAMTDMLPSGKVSVDGKWYEAIMEYGSANKGEIVKILRVEQGKMYCERG